MPAKELENVSRYCIQYLRLCTVSAPDCGQGCPQQSLAGPVPWARITRREPPDTSLGTARVVAGAVLAFLIMTAGDFGEQDLLQAMEGTQHGQGPRAML